MNYYLLIIPIILVVTSVIVMIYFVRKKTEYTIGIKVISHGEKVEIFNPATKKKVKMVVVEFEDTESKLTHVVPIDKKYIRHFKKGKILPANIVKDEHGRTYIGYLPENKEAGVPLA